MDRRPVVAALENALYADPDFVQPTGFCDVCQRGDVVIWRVTGIGMWCAHCLMLHVKQWCLP